MKLFIAVCALIAVAAAEGPKVTDKVRFEL